ncbi:MAG: hypothetical protein WCS17_04065 [Prevotella sp.]
MINERIQQLINTVSNGNKRAFSKLIGVTPTVIENIVGTRKGKPGYELLEKIVFAIENINIDWLITGRGPMLREGKSPEETAVELHPHSPPLISSAEESIIYKMYTDERAERHHVQKEKEELLQKIAVLEERLEKSESSVLSVEAVSSAKSSLRKRSATSAGVRSNE